MYIQKANKHSKIRKCSVLPIFEQSVSKILAGVIKRSISKENIPCYFDISVYQNNQFDSKVGS
jgi:hypothetical protein